jgi:hypothetical protein
MKKIILILSTFLSSSVFADFACNVNVKRVLVYANGSVNVLHSGRNDWTYICNVKGTWKGIDTVTCALWVSMLQSTQNNEKNAVFYYGGAGSCATLETYGSSPAPVYVGAID